MSAKSARFPDRPRPGPLLPGLLLVAGILMAGGGAWMMLSGSAKREAERAEALSRVSPEQFADLAAGTAVLIEGWLVALEPPGPQGFVVYRREVFRGYEKSGADKGREQWSMQGVFTPAIAVERGGARVAVTNQDYRLTSWPHVWRSEPVPSLPTLNHVSERLSGLKAGDFVTLDGRVTRDAGGPALNATAIFGGDTAAYLASLREDIVTLKIVGGLLAFFGSMLGLVGAWWLKGVGSSKSGTVPARKFSSPGSAR